MPHSTFPTAIGTCGLSWNETGLTAFHLPPGVVPPHRDAPAASEPPDVIRDLIVRVQHHLAGTMQDFIDVPLDWTRVSDFQQAVYRATAAIKPGQTRSYGDVARDLALGPEAARAVGTALGTNPWPLIIPCHRVVAANGRMTGFSAPGGVRTKTRLLALEGAELPLD